MWTSIPNIERIVYKNILFDTLYPKMISQDWNGYIRQRYRNIFTITEKRQNIIFSNIYIIKNDISETKL